MKSDFIQMIQDSKTIPVSFDKKFWFVTEQVAGTPASFILKKGMIGWKLYISDGTDIVSRSSTIWKVAVRQHLPELMEMVQADYEAHDEVVLQGVLADREYYQLGADRFFIIDVVIDGERLSPGEGRAEVTRYIDVWTPVLSIMASFESFKDVEKKWTSKINRNVQANGALCYAPIDGQRFIIQD